MHRWKILRSGLVVLSCSGLFAQSKPDKIPVLLLNAQYVYVEPLAGDGNFTDPNVSSEDRQAVTNISNAVQKWGQYKLATRRSEAQIVIAVRVGRAASAYQGGHIGVHSSPAGGRPIPQAGPVAGSETGPKQDALYVFAMNPDGTLAGPYWKNLQDHGLEMPELMLFQELKKDISAAAASLKKKNP